MKIKVGFIILIVVFLVSLFGKSHSLTLKEISKIQPGLGTIMVEFGHRFTILYYGAKSLNWELAKYELDEMVEAQEVAIITRPEYKQQLEDFEHESFAKLYKAIKNKNFIEFKKQYTNTIKACNNCHVKNNHSFIRYKLPSTPPDFLKF